MFHTFIYVFSPTELDSRRSRVARDREIET